LSDIVDKALDDARVSLALPKQYAGIKCRVEKIVLDTKLCRLEGSKTTTGKRTCRSTTRNDRTTNDHYNNCHVLLQLKKPRGWKAPTPSPTQKPTQKPTPPTLSPTQKPTKRPTRKPTSPQDRCKHCWYIKEKKCDTHASKQKCDDWNKKWPQSKGYGYVWGGSNNNKASDLGEGVHSQATPIAREEMLRKARECANQNTAMAFDEEAKIVAAMVI